MKWKLLHKPTGLYYGPVRSRNGVKSNLSETGATYTRVPTINERPWYRNCTGDKRPRTWDATFIASCAGAAEAGWRSTIAAIDGLLKRHAERQSLVETYRQKHSGYNPSCDFATEYASLLEPIIAAWPEELL